MKVKAKAQFKSPPVKMSVTTVLFFDVKILPQE